MVYENQSLDKQHDQPQHRGPSKGGQKNHEGDDAPNKEIMSIVHEHEARPGLLESGGDHGGPSWVFFEFFEVAGSFAYGTAEEGKKEQEKEAADA